MIYGVRDFRANLKRAFDSAEKGEKVIIQRGGFSFILVLDKPGPITTLDVGSGIGTQMVQDA